MLVTWMLAAAYAGDKDKDTVPNKTDECDEDAEDMDSFEDTDGCPDPDNDGDKILDATDKCANEAEDGDNFQDDDGCPDPDNDGDGVNDPDDKCPAENEDNLGAKDGCPDVSPDSLMAEGYFPAIADLVKIAVEAGTAGAAGCDKLGTDLSGWLASHDAAKLRGIYEARLARVPEGLDPKPVLDLLGNHAYTWSTIRPALDTFCKDNAGWTGVAAKVDAAMQPIEPIAPPPPPKKGKKR